MGSRNLTENNMSGRNLGGMGPLHPFMGHPSSRAPQAGPVRPTAFPTLALDDSEDPAPHPAKYVLSDGSECREKNPAIPLEVARFGWMKDTPVWQFAAREYQTENPSGVVMLHLQGLTRVLKSESGSRSVSSAINAYAFIGAAVASDLRQGQYGLSMPASDTRILTCHGGGWTKTQNLAMSNPKSYKTFRLYGWLFCMAMPVERGRVGHSAGGGGGRNYVTVKPVAFDNPIDMIRETLLRHNGCVVEYVHYGMINDDCQPSPQMAAFVNADKTHAASVICPSDNEDAIRDAKLTVSRCPPMRLSQGYGYLELTGMQIWPAEEWIRPTERG